MLGVSKSNNLLIGLHLYSDIPVSDQPVPSIAGMQDTQPGEPRKQEYQASCRQTTPDVHQAHLSAQQ